MSNQDRGRRARNGLAARAAAVLCLLALSLSACKKSSSSPTGPGDPGPPSGPSRDTAPLVLENLGTTIGPLDVAAGQAGDLFVALGYGKPFGEFGRTVGDQNGNPKQLPTFDFLVASDAPIVSAIDGVVTQVFQQSDTNDQEILIARTTNSSWFVSYDHIVNVQVAVGAHVQAGQTVGFGVPSLADFRNGAGKRQAFFELMLVNQDDGLARCPMEYLNASVRDTYRTRIQQLMHDVETLYNDATTYDEAAMVETGCVSHTISAR